MRRHFAVPIVSAAVFCIGGQLSVAADSSRDLHSAVASPVAKAAQQRAIKHNPFSRPDFGQRQQQTSVEEPEQEPLPQTLLQLKAVLYSSTTPLVNINGRILAIGEEIEGFLLQEVFEDGAILSKDEVQIMLSMTQE